VSAANKFSVDFTAEARAEMKRLRAFEERLVAQAIVTGLTYQPFVANRNRKPLVGVKADFSFRPPLWELRVNDLRVFYDGNEAVRTITIRAVRRKGPMQTTQEVLL
jgi:mRNA-degrading endonuclease RelE of RelBE toxin-antitoxin system